MKLKYIAVLFMATGVINATSLPIDMASPKVKSMLEQYHLKLVDTEYVKAKLGKGTRVSAKAVVLDARPNKKYIVGHIPTSLSIPDTKFDKFYGQIKDIDKSTELITYCGGWKCIKSPKLAAMLLKKGFSNIKIYQAGYPAWKKAEEYIEVDTAIVKSTLKKGDTVIIDARPIKKYEQSHISGAISIPDTKMDSMLDKFPKDKLGKVITYCGGYKCAKSHKVAKKLLYMGYKKVAVYAAGMPAWSKAGLPTESKQISKMATKSTKEYIEINGVQLVKNQEDNKNMVYGPWYLKLIKALPSDYVLVDVRDKDGYDAGHIPSAINIPFDDKHAKEFVEKVSRLGKKVIMSCASGAMATESMVAIIDNGGDIEKIFFVDANIDCNKNNQCKIEINDPL